MVAGNKGCMQPSVSVEAAKAADAHKRFTHARQHPTNRSYDAAAVDVGHLQSRAVYQQVHGVQSTRGVAHPPLKFTLLLCRILTTPSRQRAQS